MDGINVSFAANSPYTWKARLVDTWRLTGWSKKGLADQSGVNKGTVYKILDKKVDQPRGNTLQKLADALGVSYIWLLEGIGPQYTKLPITGYLSADESIVFADDLTQGADYGELDFDLDGVDPIVIEIRGDSMRPAYRPGEHIICSRMRGKDIDSCIRRDCAVKTMAGETYLKILKKSNEQGTFTLDSFNNAYPPIENVELEWVAPVVWVRRY